MSVRVVPAVYQGKQSWAVTGSNRRPLRCKKCGTYFCPFGNPHRPFQRELFTRGWLALIDDRRWTVDRFRQQRGDHEISNELSKSPVGPTTPQN